MPNAVFAVVQVVVTSVTLFFLYRFLLATLGVDALGVWSLVAAATSLAGVSSLGLPGGTVHFVSKYLARGDATKAGAAAETATLSTAIAMTVAALVFWPLSSWLLGLLVPPDWVEQARQLLPFTLAALWLSSVGGAIYAGLDGCHRITVRSVATIVTQPLVLVLSLWAVPHMGLAGLAAAQLVQYSVWLALGWVLLRRYLPSISRIPRKWARPMFLEMWRYGVNFQAISIVAMLLDPLSKALVSHFGGLASVGYFELANRLVVQVRAVLVAANQVLVPYYSKVAEASRTGIRGLYESNLGAMFLLSSLTLSSLVAMLPLISALWIGHLEPLFLFFAVVMTVGWFINLVGVPAYFANLGGGWISRNLFSTAVQGGGMVLFGVLLGVLGGAKGVTIAYAFALFLGCLAVVWPFHRSEEVRASVLFSRVNWTALTLGVAVAACGFISSLVLYSSVGRLAAIAAAVLVVLAGWAAFFVAIPSFRATAKQLIASSRYARGEGVPD